MNMFADTAIVGAGGYGIVLKTHDAKTVCKVLYDTDARDALRHEAHVQRRAYECLRRALPEVHVPAITYSTESSISYKSVNYLCGIGMEYVPPPLDFEEAVHMLLGYTGGDLDSSWGARTSIPVSATNPTRGFFAGVETLEWIWAQEGAAMTVEHLAYLMGRAISLLLADGILPIDLEWVWSNGAPWILDFGLCEFAEAPMDRAAVTAFLEAGGVRGLATDLYIPHRGQRGHADFLRGLFEEK